jgi:ribosomal protein S18 acetylase RimI-like enzyme
MDPAANTPAVQIVHGLRPTDRARFIDLFCSTFPEVIVPVFGSVEGCARLLRGSVAEDRVLTAIADDRLVGFAGLHYGRREWFNPSLSQLFRVMGWGVLRVSAVGIILYRRPKDDALHLDTLAVHPDMRGTGIGTRLIDAVVSLAAMEDKGLVTLDVEDINSRAKTLYERLGFVEYKCDKLPWPWSTQFSFSGSYSMRKTVKRDTRQLELPL